jgi:hypothetical protein
MSKIEILKKEPSKDFYKSLPLNENYYNIPRETFWAWVSPQNDFIQVPKLKHQGFIMQKYKNEPFGWDYDRVFNKAIEDGWVRVIYEYFPERFKGELSLNGHNLERVKSVLNDIFLNKVKYGNNSIYIDSEKPKFSKWFSTSTEDGKEKFLDFITEDRKVNAAPKKLKKLWSSTRDNHASLNEHDILDNSPEDIIKYVGNDTSGFNNKEDAIEELNYLLSADFPSGFKNIPNTVILYRVVLIENGEIINEDKIGEHFVADPNSIDANFLEKIGVMDRWGDESVLWILKCLTSKDNIDIERTIGNRLLYPRENEFTVLNDKTIKVIDKKKINKKNLSEGSLPDIQSVLKNYKLRYPKDNRLINVNINKLLKRHMIDAPNYAFDTKETSDHPGRVDRAKQFWQDFSTDQRYIHPQTKERTNWGKVDFEAPYVTIENGKLGFADGRHRVIAMKELGYDNIIIEVPKSQIHLFDELK